MVELNQGSLSIVDQKQREGLGIGWEISTFGRQLQSNTVYPRPKMKAGLYFCVFQGYLQAAGLRGQRQDRRRLISPLYSSISSFSFDYRLVIKRSRRAGCRFDPLPVHTTPQYESSHLSAPSVPPLQEALQRNHGQKSQTRHLWSVNR